MAARLLSTGELELVPKTVLSGTSYPAKNALCCDKRRSKGKESLSLGRKHGESLASYRNFVPRSQRYGVVESRSAKGMNSPLQPNWGELVWINSSQLNWQSHP